MKTYNLTACILAALCAGYGIGAAQAADEAPNTDEATPRSGLTLEEVTVTAQRREESLQRAALAVSAITAEQLASARVTQPDDLTRVAPALQVQPTGGTTNNFYLRGVGTQGANAYAENPIAFSVDGVFVGRPSAMNGYFFDLQRVEVLKGPQGTLYGRNATGGAINVITRKPQLGELNGTAGIEYGNYSNRRGNGAINVPVGERAALRVAAQAIQRDGYYSDGYDDDKNTAARAQFLIEPADTLSITLSGNYAHQGGKGSGSAPVPSSRIPLAPSLDDRVNGAEPESIAAIAAAFPVQYNSQVILPPREDGYIDSDFWGTSATIEWQTSLGTLTAIPSYQKVDGEFRSYRPGFFADQEEDVQQQSLELRFASDASDVLRYVIGAFYFDQDQDAGSLFLQGLNSGTGSAFDLGTTSYAAFGQVTFSITDTLRLVGGIRYTEEDKTQLTFTRSITPANPNPTPVRATGDLTFDDVSWRAGVELDVAPDSLLYVSVATGFKAGGFFFGTVSDNSFEPEELTAYTLGSKNRLLDHRLQLNAEAFFWDYKNQQITYIGGVPISPGIYATAGTTHNVGQAEMYGLDLDMEFLLTESDRILANVQYLHSEYTSFKYPNFSPSGAPPLVSCPFTPSPIVPINAARFYDVDCSGKPAINSPEWSVMLGLEHVFRLSAGYELIAGARSKYESERYLAIEYHETQEQESFTTSDAWLTLASSENRWSLTAWISNIEDEVLKNQAIIRPIINVTYVGLRAPRTYGLRAEYNF